MLELGVNVDHVATVRQAREGDCPSPLEAALICEKAGAWGITAHLREDRRHIQDQDMEDLVNVVEKLNMEMAATEEMVTIASNLHPYSSCLVPEKRQELTTEGGLNVLADPKWLKDCIARLQKQGIIVSIFIDPDEKQLDAARELNAEYVELHTGSYANQKDFAQRRELERLIKAAEHADNIGLKVNAGHGIDYENIIGILKIPYLCELNIGHSIVSRAVMTGMHEAVEEMVRLIKKYDG